MPEHAEDSAGGLARPAAAEQDDGFRALWQLDDALLGGRHAEGEVHLRIAQALRLHPAALRAPGFWITASDASCARRRSFILREIPKLEV